MTTLILIGIAFVALVVLAYFHRRQIRADIAKGQADVLAASERTKNAIRAEVQAGRADVNAAIGAAKKDAEKGVSAVEQRGEALGKKAEEKTAEIKKAL